MHRTTLSLILAAFLVSRTVPAQEPVNPHSAAIQDFEKRVDDYMKLHQTAGAQVPRLKSTTAPEKISDHERSIASRIREARPEARQGDIFTPEIRAEFTRLIGIATKRPADAARIKKSLRHAEPIKVKLSVNGEYPAQIPLQSTPPTLLMNLPKLPQDLEYRIAGHDLVLRDIDANLVVDYIPGIIP